MNNFEKYKLKDIGKWEDRIYDYKARFGGGVGEYPLEDNRYELIGYAADILSHYALVSLGVSGLSQRIAVKLLDPFNEEEEERVKQFYLATNPDLKLDYTVPILVDTKTGHIISNDPFDMVRSFETEWSDNTKLRSDESEKLHFEIFTNLYMEAYRAGYAEEQIEYNAGYQAVFTELDILEERLSGSRYLTGDKLTDADILLFAFLVRFDIRYVAAFRINRNLLRDMPNLWAYAKRLYALDGFGDTVDFEAIKKYSFLRSVVTNPYNKLPIGLATDEWEK